MHRYLVCKSIASVAIFIGARVIYRNSVKKMEQEIHEGELLGKDMSNKRVYLTHFRTIQSW